VTTGGPVRPGGRSRRGRRSDGPVPLAESLGALSDRLGVGQVDVVTVVFSRWEELVGPAVASHVQPQRIDGATLVVIADHPAWATQLRHLAPEILARVAEVCAPAPGPERLEIRVRR
jgi:predicted nucleic acid-binding Zn ribbon protein